MSTDPFLEPHLDACALITIDVQRDVLDGAPCEVPGTSAVLPAMAELVRTFRRRQRPIIHMVRLYLEDGSNVDPCRRSAVLGGAQLFIAGSPGSQLADGIAGTAEPLDAEKLLSGEPQEIGPDERVLFKPRWGAFFQTPLQALLAERGISTLVFCGANFPNCPRTSVYEASERDYRLVVALDATSRLTEATVGELEGIGVEFWKTADLKAELESTPLGLPT